MNPNGVHSRNTAAARSSDTAQLQHHCDSALSSQSSSSSTDDNTATACIDFDDAFDVDAAFAGCHFSPVVTPDALPTWAFSSVFSHVASIESPGLNLVPKEQLQMYIEPILAGLREIDAEDLLALERTRSGGAAVKDGVHVYPIHDKIQPPTAPEDGNVVRYLHLNEVPGQYSMGIFVFPPHAKIPLHDHPGMCVLSRILYGDLHRLSLDLPAESSNEDTSSWKKWGSPWKTNKTNTNKQNRRNSNEFGGYNYTPPPHRARRALLNEIDYLEAPGVTCLYPFEGNLHEFVAGQNGAAVLDVLLPPYNAQEGRDCTFYEIQEICEDGSTFLKDRCLKDKQKLCWIVRTGQPEDFHCISGKYKQMGSAF